MIGVKEETTMSEMNKCIRSGIVSFGDHFDLRREVFKLFGKMKCGVCGRKDIWKDNEGNIVCLLKEEDEKSGWKNMKVYGDEFDGRGWKEVVGIEMENNDVDEYDRFRSEMKDGEMYVFYRMKRLGVEWYKFYGMFKFEEGEKVILRRLSKIGEVRKEVV